MLTYSCEECRNTTAIIKKDNEGDVVSECLACGHVNLILSTTDLSVDIKAREHEWEPTDSQGYSMQCLNCAETYSFYDEAERNVLSTSCRSQMAN